MHTLQTLDVLQNDYTTDTRRSTKTTTRADVPATYTRRSIKTTTSVDTYATYTRRSIKTITRADAYAYRH